MCHRISIEKSLSHQLLIGIEDRIASDPVMTRQQASGRQQGARCQYTIEDGQLEQLIEAQLSRCAGSKRLVQVAKYMIQHYLAPSIANVLALMIAPTGR